MTKQVWQGWRQNTLVYLLPPPHLFGGKNGLAYVAAKFAAAHPTSAAAISHGENAGKFVYPKPNCCNISPVHIINEWAD